MSSNASASAADAADAAKQEVEDILERRQHSQSSPTDADLGPVYTFLLPSTDSSSSSSFEETHWYCSQAPSDLHRRAATFLIFLFAFKREGTSKRWIDNLTLVLTRCTNCAQEFTAARRRFAQLYLSKYPSATQTNFFAAVNKWQAGVIVGEFDLLQPYARPQTLFDLAPAFLQLLFNEPTLLDDPQLKDLLNQAISSTSDATPLPSLTSGLVALLSSTDLDRRSWAHGYLSRLSRPLSFREWHECGTGREVMTFLGSSDQERLWSALHSIVRPEVLTVETIQRGLLEGQFEAGVPPRLDRSIMTLIARHCGSPTKPFDDILSVFQTLLHLSPTHHIWAFDTSPELPHTLFSEIKNNRLFKDLVDNYQPKAVNGDYKGKGKADDDQSNPLIWINGFLLSVLDTPNAKTGAAFPEALAKVMSYCLSEMQHDRLGASTHILAAEAGCKALLLLQKQITPDDIAFSALSMTIDVHAATIARFAFQDTNNADMAPARSAARELAAVVFKSDGREIIESVLGLATIAYTERRRLKRKRRAKAGQPVPPPVPVEKLHRASLRSEMWKAAHSEFSPTDSIGLGLLMTAAAPLAHLEILNRDEAWSPDDLKEVVKTEDWIASVRAINRGVKTSRDGFARALESLAAQPDPAILQTFWNQPNIASTVVKLLLSPDEAVHEPVLNLIQRSFEDVDDRADCSRTLLARYPAASMDGLCNTLSSFIQTARIVPEACSLAKWLVRCFTDVLDALCQPEGMSAPLLQTESFLSSYADGKWMTRRVSDLWQLMTDSLALIFKRTSDWAPYYENEVMVDWMRDALIFGRMITEHIRVFESAILSRATSRSDPAESPVRMSHVGKSLVQKLEVVLFDLTGWLRLTDAETLHQAYELIKTILGRVSKSNVDLSKEKQLESALLELDKFTRRVSSAYNCRLSDDLMSELTDLLETFDLPSGRDEDEIKFVKEVKGATPEVGSDTESVSAKLRRAAITQDRESPKPTSSSSSKNAFAMMMNKAGGKYVASEGKPRPAKPTKPRQMTLEEFESDDTLDNLSASDLDIIERRAQALSSSKEQRARVHKVQPKDPKDRLILNLVPKVVPPKSSTSSAYTSKFMRDLHNEHVAQERKKNKESGFAPRLPQASAIGTGLGAYTGPPKTVKPPPKPVETDSSDSASSSDEEGKGLGALLAPKKIVMAPRPAAPRRTIKPMGPTAADIIKEREEKRRKAHATKQRLRPDLTPLFRYVLQWDPSHQGPKPPHPPKVDAELGPLRQVPTTFARVQDYERIMLPIFLQELWAQFNKDAQTSAPLLAEVTTRAYEDDFLDLDVVIPTNLPPGFSVNDSDIVSLQAEGGVKIFAKVQGFRRKFKESAIKLRILSSVDQRGFGVKAKVQVLKHASLSTALREYAALRGLPYYEPSILSDVLGARSAAMPSLDSSDVTDAMNKFQLNEPQAKAVLGAMKVKGFALIQGPPGTGKTKTISGLVGKFMSERRAFIPVNGEAPTKAKILVCAPSNAAIDEVCKRLMEGVPSAHGGRIHPNIVRIGIEASVNIAVKDVALDNIVEARVSAESQRQDGGGTELARIQNDLEEVKRLIKEKQEDIQKAQGDDPKRKALEAEFHVLSMRRTKLGQASSKAKDAARDATRHLDGARRAARDAVLKEADVICATLSGSGQDVLAPYTFETVIIDEAAQATEMSGLIPLKYGCQRCIMVGDPNQLPPTTFSSEAAAMKFDQSLFVRIAQHHGSHMHLLSIQYRMHPSISKLPSKVFYDGRLQDGPGMAEKTAAVWHQRDIFGPYHFVNVQGVETKKGMSTCNTEEALVAVDLYRNLEQQFGKKVNLAMRIGVITMYREQLYELRRQFSAAFGQDIVESIDFNTVDGFQGQEKDIIILSCVRSGLNLMTIGFLRDFRRMNVALTRAKSSLFVLGNAATLERSDQKWNTIVKDARERNLLVDYTKSLFSTPNSPRPEAKIKSESKKSKSDRGDKGEKRPRLSKTPSDTPNGKKRKTSPADSEKSSKSDKVKQPKIEDNPPPPKAPPPTIPPPPVRIPIPGASTASPPRPPRPVPTRPAEDVLFMKKKKKPRPGAPAASAPKGNPRPPLNSRWGDRHP